MSDQAREHHADSNGNGNGHRPPSFAEMAYKPLKAWASLQLTVVLFALGMVLVFFGTLAQIDLGIWTVVDRYFKAFVVWIPLQLIAQFGMIFCGLDSKTVWAGSFPIPGGLTIGFLMLFNLLAAHAIRFKVSWKRSGILLIHSGVVALLLGELVTKFYAVEANMTIPVGGSVNYVENLRSVELAIADPSDPQFEQVTLVRAGRLAKGGDIDDDKLPFKIHVDQYMVNSRIDKLEPNETSPATRGTGVHEIARERPEVSGTDPNQPIDIPAAYLTFKRKDNGESLGTYLVVLQTSDSPRQEVEVDGKKYEIALRFKRIYKPYTLHLQKFEHSVYPGTEKAKDFASTVRLVDPEDGEDREVRIWMNHPLRHRGETFYQHSFFPGDGGTILQVVDNPAWTVPYIACLMIAGGMLVHFLIVLIRFLDRLAPTRAAKLSRIEAAIPYIIVGVMALYFVGKAKPPSVKEGEMDLYSAGEIPVQEGGRAKPLDTVARTRLQVISCKQEFSEGKIGEDDSGPSWLPIDFGKKREPAMRWLLDALSDGRNQDSAAWKHRVVRIDNDQVLNLLQLKPRPGFYRYSLEEIYPHFAELEDAKRVADKKEKLKRDVLDVKVLELHNHLGEFLKLLHLNDPGFIPTDSPEKKWATLLDIDKEIAKNHHADIEALRDKVAEQTHDPQLLAEFLQARGIPLEKLQALPPEQARGLIKLAREKLENELMRDQVTKLVEEHRPAENPQGAALNRILSAYKAQDAKEFNAAVADYHRDYDGKIPEDQLHRVKLEAFFNHFSPFYLCGVMYIIVFVLGDLSWLGYREPLRRSALGLMILTFAVHTAALLIRMYVQGRPPVTNLYSSAVFIGWGSVLVSIILELIYRNSVGNVVGAVLGFATMRIAYFLGGSGDSLEMMEAVLDTNLWLATHVTIVTFGYVATFIAGFISIVYLMLGLFTTMLAGELNKRISQMIYGVVCFAMFLSFTGTVLGGIWADQSWGRFWGWDAKENGAVLVVIWNAMILHARWCGLIKQRGMAVMAIAGNMVTVWSWFGTNQLGAGLHAYGFNNQLATGCLVVWCIHVGLILIGMTPLRIWRSFSEETVRRHAEETRKFQQAKKQFKQEDAALS